MALAPSVTAAFAACEADGWAWCPGAVPAPGDLLQELQDVELVPLEPEVGQVRQQGATGVAAIAGRPRLAALAEELAVASGGWRPDELALGRYGADGGISAHRDNTFYAGFVVVLTVSGRAGFDVLADRAGTVVLGHVTTGPGDLVLLRGPRDDGPDARPFHRVGPPLDGPERVVLVLRQNTRGAGRGWSWEGPEA